MIIDVNESNTNVVVFNKWELLICLFQVFLVNF